MGKKNSTFKNIMVTLGCTIFASAYVIGGGYAISSFLGGGTGSTLPAWLDRVEIRVDEETARSSVAEAPVTGEADAVQNYAGQEPNGSRGGDDGSSSGSIMQEPRFRGEQGNRTETEPEPETELETGTEPETDSEQGTDIDDMDKEPETETESAMTKDGQDSGPGEKPEKSEKNRGSVEVSHVQVIQQEQAAAVMADVTAVVKVAMPCVVSITNEYTAYDYWYDETYDEEANGSGIIVAQSDEELLIVTNYHVIEDNNNLYVQFIDDREATAYVKGTSPDNDLAIVSVFLDEMTNETLESIAIAALGDSDSLQVGEPAIAIGNSLGYGQSVTTGVISALNRNIFEGDPDFNQGYLIQTDAAINPGNSGGALLNVRGEVIGINSSKIADYVIEGMGYAIPISTAKPIIEDLMQRETRKKVPAEERAFLGITGTDVTEEASERYAMPKGVYVNKVLKDTAADRAGILKGDIIIYIDNEKLTRMDELQSLLEYYAAGTKVEVVLMRQTNGEYREMAVDVMLGYKE